MNKIFLLFAMLAAVCFTRPSNAQPAVGELAPDFNLKDINGITHHLYDYLDSGYMVVIDASCTWCSPCWGFHNTHMANTITTKYGPNGTVSPKKIKWLFFETDKLTGMNDLMGNTSASQGDWVTGTNYPIIDSAALVYPYKVKGYPTFIAICKDKRVKLYNVGTPAGGTTESFWVNLANGCPAPSATVDASVVSQDETVNACKNTVWLENMSSQPLTNASIKVYDGATLLHTQPWTGNLAGFKLAPINFPSGALGLGVGTRKFKVEVNGDQNAANDEYVSEFSRHALSANKIRIEIRTDKYPTETAWKLYDGDVIVAEKQYAKYDTLTVFTYDYTVSAGACLRFVSTDFSDNGMYSVTSFTTADDGYVKFYDGQTNAQLLTVAGPAVPFVMVKHFKAAGTSASVSGVDEQNEMNIAPNPAHDIVKVTFKAPLAQSGQLLLTDITGRSVYTKALKAGEQSLEIVTSGLAPGIYTLHVNAAGSTHVQKLEVQP